MAVNEASADVFDYGRIIWHDMPLTLGHNLKKNNNSQRQTCPLHGLIKC